MRFGAAYGRPVALACALAGNAFRRLATRAASRPHIDGLCSHRQSRAKSLPGGEVLCTRGRHGKCSSGPLVSTTANSFRIRPGDFGRRPHEFFAKTSRVACARPTVAHSTGDWTHAFSPVVRRVVPTGQASAPGRRTTRQGTGGTTNADASFRSRALRPWPARTNPMVADSV